MVLNRLTLIDLYYCIWILQLSLYNLDVKYLSHCFSYSDIPTIHSFKYQHSFQSFSTAKHVLNSILLNPLSEIDIGLLGTHPLFKHEMIFKTLRWIPFRVIDLIFNQIYKPTRKLRNLHISFLPYLETITFCTFCVPTVSSIIITHCNRLLWVEVAPRPYDKSLRQTEDRLEIRNCKNLKRITIGDSSFDQYKKFIARGVWWTL